MSDEAKPTPLGQVNSDTGRPAPSPASAPRDLKVKLAEQKLLIEWNDGHHSEFSLGELRRVCPCATCRTEREKQGANPLKILKADPSNLRVVSAKLVGKYAIQLIWSDGHDTGIYDFRFLRTLGDH